MAVNCDPFHFHESHVAKNNSSFWFLADDDPFLPGGANETHLLELWPWWLTAEEPDSSKGKRDNYSHMCYGPAKAQVRFGKEYAELVGLGQIHSRDSL